MLTSRTISAPIAAVLGAAVLAGPAAARPIDPNQPVRHTSHRQVANVYVPPASLWRDATVTPQVYVPPASLWRDATVTPSSAARPAPIVKAPVSSPDTGFNWEAAGIGAVAGGVVAFSLTGVTRRRRRHALP